jgi:hypothetical protein
MHVWNEHSYANTCLWASLVTLWEVSGQLGNCLHGELRPLSTQQTSSSKRRKWKRKGDAVLQNDENVEVSWTRRKQIVLRVFRRSYRKLERVFIRLDLCELADQCGETCYEEDVADVNSWIRQQCNVRSTILRNVIRCCSRSARWIPRTTHSIRQRSMVHVDAVWKLGVRP